MNGLMLARNHTGVVLDPDDEQVRSLRLLLLGEDSSVSASSGPATHC
jgi:hypothetical protein